MLTLKGLHKNRDFRANGSISGAGPPSCNLFNEDRMPFLVDAEKMSSQEEYGLFLRKHSLDYDEAHVWD